MPIKYFENKRIASILDTIQKLEALVLEKEGIRDEIERNGINADLFKMNLDNYNKREELSTILIRGLIKNYDYVEKLNELDLPDKNKIHTVYGQIKTNEFSELIGIKSIEELIELREKLIHQHKSNSKLIDSVYSYLIEDTIKIEKAKSENNFNKKR